MPAKSRIDARSIASSTAFALVLVAGCGTQEPPPANPGAPTPTAPGPGGDLKGMERDLEEIKKDVTPPVIIKPDQPPPPATGAGRAG